MGVLDGKAVLITGGAGGIGSVLAAALLADGAAVCAVDARADGLDRLADHLRSQGADGARFLPVTADLRDAAACERAVREAELRFDGLYGLINNVGVSLGIVRPDYLVRPLRFWEIAPEQWDTIVDINLRAAFLMARASVPGMIRRGAGRVVNVTTGLQNMMRPGATPYGPSKAALEAASAIWAAETAGSGVTVNVVEPGGPVDTAMIPADAAVDRKALLKPEVMIEPVRWLLSDAAAAVSGSRYTARMWDGSLPPAEAAVAIRRPIGWPGLGHASITPDSLRAG